MLRLPAWQLPVLRLLDTYVCKLALKVAALTFVGLLGIFYISTFIDLSDKLFKGQTTAAMLAEFFYYKTPEFIFFIIPLTVLIGVMVTIGILTKNSELVVMQACGISLYRVAVPMVMLAIVASGSMFLLQDRVLPFSNRRAQALRHVIRGGTPRTFDVINRKWLMARDGSIYNYTYYDQRRHELNGLSIYDFDKTHGDLETAHLRRAGALRAVIGPEVEVGQRLGARVHQGHGPEDVRDVPGARPRTRGARVLRDRSGGARPDDVRAAQALHRGSVGQRRQRRARRRWRCTARSRSRS